MQDDELIDTMREDQASSEFVQQRIQEIVEECFSNDREELIEKLSMQYALLQADHKRIESEYQKVVLRSYCSYRLSTRRP